MRFSKTERFSIFWRNKQVVLLFYLSHFEIDSFARYPIRMRKESWTRWSTFHVSNIMVTERKKSKTQNAKCEFWSFLRKWRYWYCCTTNVMSLSCRELFSLQDACRSSSFKSRGTCSKMQNTERGQCGEKQKKSVHQFFSLYKDR